MRSSGGPSRRRPRCRRIRGGRNPDGRPALPMQTGSPCPCCVSPVPAPRLRMAEFRSTTLRSSWKTSQAERMVGERCRRTAPPTAAIDGLKMGLLTVVRHATLGPRRPGGRQLTPSRGGSLFSRRRRVSFNRRPEESVAILAEPRAVEEFATADIPKGLGLKRRRVWIRKLGAS